MTLPAFRCSLPAAVLGLAVLPTLAQPAPAASAPAASAPAPQRLERVQIIGGRPGDTEQRRQSTAAKIVVGREEIERFGDSTVGEILKRLPGVTMQGPPGRGGNIRMRGLGSGYTQILIDGERVPPGFALDSMTPEQIERIEILRAPTAETGARAIAGTINIVTREGFRRRINDLRAALGFEHGNVDPHLAWTRNDAFGDWTVNLSPSVYTHTRDTDTLTSTVRRSLADGATSLEQTEHATSHTRRKGLHATARLQWRGDGGDLLTIAPFVLHLHGPVRRDATLQRPVDETGEPPPGYDHASTAGDTRFSLTRLNVQWNRRLGEGTRLEWRGHASRAHSVDNNRRSEFADGVQTRFVDEGGETRDDTLGGGAKLSAGWAPGHTLVAGAELEETRREESRRPLLADFADRLNAGSTRGAVHAQNEWNAGAHWALHAGLRWEGITTRGDGAEGARITNRTAVWTPLAHAVWKPDPQGRDQLRLSLTRSWRSPSLQNLIAQPSVNSRYPADTPNVSAFPDRAGNPDLRPELAAGIDVAVERYLPGGGLLSANVFHRRIRDLIRTLTTQEDVAWSEHPRWVARPQNIGRAMTQGLELEAKFRVSDLWPQRPPVDLRANLSFFRSRVASVPGPDNRLDQQPAATANLGFDYRLRRLPLTVGGNLNWTPGYDTRLDDAESSFHASKRVVDAYLLWTFDPTLRLRVSASNLAPYGYDTRSTFVFDGSQEDTQTTYRGFANVQIRLEMKL